MDITKLATSEEIKEINVTLQHLVKYVPTFIQFGTQFYRIIEPKHHPHIHSDMSIEGMKEWKVLP